jgi:hypothetical protein
MEPIPEGWTDFGVAAAGATAALAGLLIVAMSVNVDQIIHAKAPIAGARSTIASLVLAIAVSLLILPAAQTVVALGVITLVLTAIAVVIQLMSIAAQWNLTREGVTGPIRATIVALATAEHVPFLVGAVMLIAGLPSGMWGILIGVVMVVIASMVNAWVLLIEVRR